MITKIEEPVVVAAIFGRKPTPLPVWFIWHGRCYRIEDITYTWTDKEGRAKRYHFSVTDGVNLYQLLFHSADMSWQLTAVETTG